MADVDEVHFPLVPQHVVLTEVSVYKVAHRVHALHSLCRTNAQNQLVGLYRLKKLRWTCFPTLHVLMILAHQLDS